MTSIALFGAGGKMGHRLSRNLNGSRFAVRHVEVSEAGRARLAQDFGIACVLAEEALAGAEVVILAVPDTHIGKVAQSVQHLLKPGMMVVVLDAAAPFAGHLPERPDLTYFVTHPCHPPIFNDETDPEAKKDRFGGIAAKQHIVSALMQGPEEHYALGEEVARTIWAPVMRSHRVSVEQMALLEPGLSETVVASLLDVMRHMNILGAVIFKEQPGVFSDACNKAIQFGKPMLMRDDWKRVFEPGEIAASIRRIT